MNKHTGISSITTPRKQQGAVLVFAMTILMVLTMLGVTAVNTTGLELKMVINSQLLQQSLASAEDTLLYSENIIQDTTNTTANNQSPPNMYQSTALPTAENLAAADWWLDDDNTLKDPANGNRYIFSRLGTIVPGGSGGFVDFYRITARSAGAQGAFRMVETIYARYTPP